jgi:hypothetical protein
VRRPDGTVAAPVGLSPLSRQTRLSANSAAARHLAAGTALPVIR